MFEAPIDWIADTGSAQDLLTDHHVPDHCGYYSENPMRLITANGESASMKQRQGEGSRAKPLRILCRVRPHSFGWHKVHDEGFNFVWRGSKNEKLYMVRPDGKSIELEVRDYVPYLCSKSHQSSVFVAGTDPEVHKPISRVKVLASSSKEAEVPNSEDKPFSPPWWWIWRWWTRYCRWKCIPAGTWRWPCSWHFRWSGSRCARSWTSHHCWPGGHACWWTATGGGLSSQSGNGEEKGKGKAALKAEAKSKRHIFTHIPKNPYCEVCNKAKMYKPPAYAKGGSSMVEAKKFGDHATGDCLLAKPEPETGIDDVRVAMISLLISVLSIRQAAVMPIVQSCPWSISCDDLKNLAPAKQSVCIVAVIGCLTLFKHLLY